VNLRRSSAFPNNVLLDVYEFVIIAEEDISNQLGFSKNLIDRMEGYEGQLTTQETVPPATCQQVYVGGWGSIELFCTKLVPSQSLTASSIILLRLDSAEFVVSESYDDI
jgi:hypothetical protein